MNWKPVLKNRWMVLLGVLGLVLLLFGSVWGRSGGALATLAAGSAPGGNSTNANQPTTATGSAQGAALATNSSLVDPALAFENMYDKQLTTLLDDIAGVHNVSVMVTLAATESLQLANNTDRTTQTQANGSSPTSQSSTVKRQVLTVRNADGAEQPVVIARLTPAVRGVLVVVNAADFYLAKSEIIDAITNVLDVPAYKISVEPAKPSS